MSLLEPIDNARGASTFVGLRTHGALVVVQVAFAVGAVEGKLAMRPSASAGGGVDPFALAMARMLGGALFFQIALRIAGKLRPIPFRDHAPILGLSLLGIVLNQSLFLVGLRITTAFAAVLLGVTIPVLTTGLSIAFGLERPSARTAIGLALALTGVLWLTGIGTLDWGALAIAANCLSYALYLTLCKGVIARYGAMTVVAWLFTWGVIMFTPLGLRPLLAGFATWSPRAWTLVAVMVALPTIVAYSANAWALGRSGPTLVAVYIYLQPLLAAALQWVQLGEPIAEKALIAASFILVGVGVVASRRSATLLVEPTAGPASE